jgi:predicted molibdopterin-dependent oxidoreductase YjgC
VNTVIGTYGGWLDCSQCGNCIEVCPTGTLLDGVYRHETRPWELDQTISTDPYSSDGMQLSIGSRGGEVHRIVARDRYVNGLNGEFLDVKARFGHGFVNHAERIKTPLIRYAKGGRLVPATWDDAIKHVAGKFSEYSGSAGVIASPRLTNEAVFTLRRFAQEALKTDNFAVSDRYDQAAFFDNLSVPLSTHKEIRNAGTIVLIGGEPEEEQTFTAKQIRQAVRNGGARFVVVNDTPIRLNAQAQQFIHINEGSYDAFVLALTGSADNALLAKAGIEASQIETLLRTIGESQGDIVIIVGGDLSLEAQAVLAGSAGSFASDARRVLLHPLPPYNNSVGAHDMTAGRKSVEEVARGSRALLVGGGLQDAEALRNAEFVVVQELFQTASTEFADVVLPAASFAEVDGTYTNNTGFVQRVRKAIEPVHQAKPDWMITSLIAREMGVELLYDLSASSVFRSIADSVPAYEGLRYPMLKDESRPAQARHALGVNADISAMRDAMLKRVEAMPENGDKNFNVPKVGHKLHRLTVMTSKTEQFHLLAHGNPKPENLLVSPLVQFHLDGSPKEEGLAEAAAVTVSDRAAIGVNK